VKAKTAQEKLETQHLRFEVFAASLGLNLRRTPSGLYRKPTT